MNVDAKRELDSIKTALSAEIRELEDISSGLAELCAKLKSK